MRARFQAQLVPQWEHGYLRYHLHRSLLQVFKLHVHSHVRIMYQHAKVTTLYQIQEVNQQQLIQLRQIKQQLQTKIIDDFKKMSSFAQIRFQALKKDWLGLVECSQRTSKSGGTLYLQKRKKLKYAVEMFYKNCQILQKFIQLNVEAVRSLISKYIKYTDILRRAFDTPQSLPQSFEKSYENSFVGSFKEQFQTFKSQIRQNYLRRFYHQYSRAQGVQCLNRPLSTFDKKPTSHQLVYVGLYLGILLLTALILPIGFLLNIFQFQKFYYVGPIYRGAALFLCYLWGYSINVFIWSKFHINYQLILRMGTHFSSFVQIVKRNAFFTAVLLLIFLLHVLQQSSSKLNIGIEYLPIAFYLIFFGYIFFPSETVFNPRGRKYFYNLLYDIIFSPLPFIEITFLINWATDQLVSFAGPLRDLAYTICFYTNQNTQADQLQCRMGLNFKTIITGYVVVLIPLLYRMAQCLRVAYGSQQFFSHIQFKNFIKYCLSALNVTFAFIFKFHYNFLSIFIIFSILSTGYAYYWDMKHDWGFLQAGSRYPLLRSNLSFKNPNFYYIIIIINLILRSAWTLSITNVGEFVNSDLLVFFTSFLQILRRCLWNFFRVEKEHLANCGYFRATEDISSLVEQVDKVKKQKTSDVYNLEDLTVFWIDLSFATSMRESLSSSQRIRQIQKIYESTRNEVHQKQSEQTLDKSLEIYRDTMGMSQPYTRLQQLYSSVKQK